ncbi:MAG: AAA family ATPase [Pseudomonadota bacterium]|jgi:pilus assembly protein CpaE
MSTSVIASTDTLMNTLRSSILQSQLPLHNVVTRQPGQALLPLLSGIDSGTLLLDSPPGLLTDDLTALESWLRSRPQLNVLLFSEDSSKALLLRAMRAGVRELLTLPPQPQELALSLARWGGSEPIGSTNPGAPTSARLVAFMGCKGGNGTSFVAANMAHIVADEYDLPCAFVDLDLQCGDASFYLGSGANKNTLSDLTRQIERLDAQLLTSCMHAVTPRLSLLAAPQDLESAMAIGAPEIEKVLQLVRSLVHAVVVDLPRNLNALSLKVLDMADVVVIVMQNTTPDVRDAQRLVSMLRALGYSEVKLRLLVNRFAPDAWVSLSDLEKTVGLKVSQTIPNNTQWVSEALHTGQPLSAVHDHNAVMHALRESTAELLDTRPPKQRHWMQRWMGKAA